jgi:hypothetical protein
LDQFTNIILYPIIVNELPTYGPYRRQLDVNATPEMQNRKKLSKYQQIVSTKMYHHVPPSETFSLHLRAKSVWQMKYNIVKCKVIPIGFKTLHYIYNSSMSGKNLNDSNGKRARSWISGNQQTEVIRIRAVHTNNRASRMLGMVAKTIFIHSLEILLKIYTSIVRPHLEH